MDPNVPNEQRGLSEDGSRDQDSGTSYLRQLKMRTAGALGMPLATTAAALAPQMKERRSTPRFEYTRSIEVRPEDSGVRLWGALKDISLNGCYVEMTTTFPVNTTWYIALEAGGLRLVGEAMVHASYPSLGMGCPLRCLLPRNGCSSRKFWRPRPRKEPSPRQNGIRAEVDLETRLMSAR